MSIRIIHILLLFNSFTLLAQESWKFEFGVEKHAVLTNLITESLTYSDEYGFGFDFENKDQVTISSSGNPETGFCTSEKPFYFSAMVPEGTYEVIVLLGNPDNKSVSTVKAEARRLMLDNYPLKKGESKKFSFTVSVRSPMISPGRSIRLKPREVNYMNWDNRLTLEFSGRHVAVQGIEIKPKDKFTTVFLAGNSTVTDQDCAPWASWGQMITRYFDSSVSLANYAESGESLASFKNAGRLDKLLSHMQPGDYLFIEFGHNDQKQKGEGIGPWDSFTELLKEFIESAREKGGIPVLLTPTQRRSFNEAGKIQYTHGDYPEAMRKAASDMHVPLIDLNEMTKIMYETWGPEDSKRAFVQYPAGTFPEQKKELKDNTHFSPFGAHEIALCVLQGISDLELDIKGKMIDFNENYDPAHPYKFKHWKVPMSPRFVSKKPEGN